jgi:hypothetical protein
LDPWRPAQEKSTPGSFWEGIMVEIGIVKLCCAFLAAGMAGATFGFFAAAILANSKYRDTQAEKET